MIDAEIRQIRRRSCGWKQAWASTDGNAHLQERHVLHVLRQRIQGRHERPAVAAAGPAQARQLLQEGRRGVALVCPIHIPQPAHPQPYGHPTRRVDGAALAAEYSRKDRTDTHYWLNMADL